MCSVFRFRDIRPFWSGLFNINCIVVLDKNLHEFKVLAYVLYQIQKKSQPLIVVEEWHHHQTSS